MNPIVDNSCGDGAGETNGGSNQSQREWFHRREFSLGTYTGNAIIVGVKVQVL